MTEIYQDRVGPTNPLVTPLLTDFYQITMCYAYWKNDRAEDLAVFDLFFRKAPFQGEFTIFAGLEECLRHVATFKFSESEIVYLRTQLPHAEPGFFDYLTKLDCSAVNVYAVCEGNVVFPRIPLLRVEGPLGVCQLLETTLLNLTNFPSLIATNAARMRLAAGSSKKLLEFGLRRAQGPDGAMTASKYAVLGGFDGTSNVAAGKAFNIMIKGTHAHAFVCAYSGPDELKSRWLGAVESTVKEQKLGVNFWDRVIQHRSSLGWEHTNLGELAAFVSYAQAFPNGFLALVDTYDTLDSGVKNFLCVGLALLELGHQPVGIRLDSGDLSYLSVEARKLFFHVSEEKKVDFHNLSIVASNDINEEVLLALEKQGHEIDIFGIGTNLVTCQAQPALGMVYKLVAVNGRATMKLSNEFAKVSLPGRKRAFRIIGKEGVALCDVMIGDNEQEPRPGQRMLCCHPFIDRKRVYVTPESVIPLLQLVWNGENRAPPPPSDQMKKYSREQMKLIRADHMRAVNPTLYKVSVSKQLHDFVHDMWLHQTPVQELS